MPVLRETAALFVLLLANVFLNSWGLSQLGKVAGFVPVKSSPCTGILASFHHSTAEYGFILVFNTERHRSAPNLLVKA